MDLSVAGFYYKKLTLVLENTRQLWQSQLPVDISIGRLDDKI
jgi:hypothetical protein